jgi:hemoglobin
MQIDLEKHEYGEEDASFRAAGGLSGIKNLVEHFYRVMGEVPEGAHIRSMHPADLEVSRDKLTLFLCGWLGGPRLFQEKYGPIHIPGAHAHLIVALEERDAWLFCMERALEEVDYAPAFKRYLMRELAVPAERVRQAARD